MKIKRLYLLLVLLLGHKKFFLVGGVGVGMCIHTFLPFYTALKSSSHSMYMYVCMSLQAMLSCCFVRRRRYIDW